MKADAAKAKQPWRPRCCHSHWSCFRRTCTIQARTISNVKTENKEDVGAQCSKTCFTVNIRRLSITITCNAAQYLYHIAARANKQGQLHVMYQLFWAPHVFCRPKASGTKWPEMSSWRTIVASMTTRIFSSSPRRCGVMTPWRRCGCKGLAPGVPRKSLWWCAEPILSVLVDSFCWRECFRQLSGWVERRLLHQIRLGDTWGFRKFGYHFWYHRGVGFWRFRIWAKDGLSPECVLTIA